jgi:hypothetical protein
MVSLPPDACLSTGTHGGCVTNSPAMRALVIALILAAGCGGKRQVGPGGPGAAAGPFPAARWVPATPTYVFAAPTMRAAQLGFTNAIDTVGLAAGVEPAQVSAALAHFLQVDLLSADSLASIGIDVDGSMALFSAEIDPTLVVHLASPQALQAFIAKQRERGMVSQSVVVDGTEVQTAKVDDMVSVSWAVEGDWLWLHASFAMHGDASNWFAASKLAGQRAATWTARWQAAQQLAHKAAGLTGLVDLRALTAKLAARVPDFAACARQFEAVDGIGVALEAEGTYVGGALSVDVGGRAPAIGQSVLAPPPGWSAASAKAPLAAQWNLDLRAVAAWLQPCIGGNANLTAMLDQFGVRSARAFVHTLDPDDKSGTGAIAIDLSHPKYFEQLLGQIPMRSKFERSRQFGAYKGKHLAVPFVATADYVLDDRIFLAAMGDGLLERAATGAPAGPPPVFAVDVVPAGLPVGVWAWLLAQAEVPGAKRVAERLQSWNDIHFNAHLDRDALVIEAQGNRR